MIVGQKNEILENARRLRESLVDENTGDYVGENSTFSMHMAEHGTDEMEREKAYMLIQRDEKHLYYLENALERIEKKTYGLCISCGRPIDKGRLEAVPITQHCIKCKTNLSNGN
jgi:RNA polymerase-binding protein DksA